MYQYKLSFILLLCGIVGNIQSQTIITTNANYAEKNNISISYVIGDLIIGTAQNNGIMLNQGFSVIGDSDFIDTIVSIDKIEMKRKYIYAFPNPVEKILTVNNIESQTDFVIYNSNGQSVKKGIIDATNNIIDMESQIKGIYILSFIQKKNVIKNITIIKK